VSVHAVRGFAYLVEYSFERYTLGLLPMAKCIVENPVARESSVD
jgi:hypothetical protein